MPARPASFDAKVVREDKAALDGKLLTLQKIQSQVEENGKIQDWIDRHQLATRQRLWQKIRVEAGWESAVESALRDRLHALDLSDPELLQRLLDDQLVQRPHATGARRPAARASSRGTGAGDRARSTGASKYTNLGRLWVAVSDLRGVMWLIRRARDPSIESTPRPRETRRGRSRGLLRRGLR